MITALWIFVIAYCALCYLMLALRLITEPVPVRDNVDAILIVCLGVTFPLFFPVYMWNYWMDGR